MSAPQVPDIAEGSQSFSSKMRVFHAWEAGELWAALTAFFDSRLLSTSTVSTSSITIDTASTKTFAVETNKGFLPGMFLVAANTGASSNFIAGQVVSYSGSTLVMSNTSRGGSGSFGAWTISQSVTGGGAVLSTNTFTGAQNFAQGADIASAATINLTTATGNLVNITGTTAISAVTLGIGMTRLVRAVAALPLTYNATTNNITGGVSTVLAAGDHVFYHNIGGVVYGLIMKANGRAVVETIDTTVNARQSIQYGARDANGQPALIAPVAPTLAAGVDLLGATTPFMISVGNGFNADGSQRNINRVFTTDINSGALTANTKNYIVLDAVTGLCSVTTTEDNFQYGGTIPVTSGQYTYDYANHVMYLGNGTTAVQSNRIVVAEVDTNATVVTNVAIRQYGRTYEGAWTNTLPSVLTILIARHQFGVIPKEFNFEVNCLTTEANIPVGTTLQTLSSNQSGVNLVMPVRADRRALELTTGSAASFFVSQNRNTGANFALTPANWRYRFVADRGW
jgi:hypothetical protein